MIGFLIFFPLVAALLVLLIHAERVRDAIVVVSAIGIGFVSLAMAFVYFGQSGVISFSSPVVDYACSIIGVVIAAWIIAYSIKYRNALALILGIIQVVANLVLEFGYAHTLHLDKGLYFDPLTMLMVLIIGIVGSGICVYAVGYMKDFQIENKDQKDRRPVFFALMLVFLSSMFGVVFSDNLLWLFTAWEVTTLCSFLLIGYTKTEEAIKNAFRQIVMNLLGGIAFVVALFFIVIYFDTISFMEFLTVAVLHPGLAAIPVTCLAFAGITKAAQMPFHTWLLGAMVAPTPTSALLHSSTMVKAGVFLLVKMAPVFSVSLVPSIMVVLVGGVTFVLCSMIAISETNAKRVLAYSTVANLGLIVATAGVGTPGAIWAAIFLIIFHALAKSLLFLCVGTAEHHIGSRDIEDMDLLFERMPGLTRFMMLGIMAMFIAPFGMLIAKWATLISFVDTRQIALLILLAYGSAATFMFWSKWFGKLAGIAGKPDNQEAGVHRTEWASIRLMAILLVGTSATIPLVSGFIIEPYIVSVFGSGLAANTSVSGISDTSLWVTSVAMLLVTIVLFFGLQRSKAKKVDVYMSGVGIHSDERTFRSSLSQEIQSTSRNWYLADIFGDKMLAPIGVISTSVIIGISFVGAALSALGLL